MTRGDVVDLQQAIGNHKTATLLRSGHGDRTYIQRQPLAAGPGAATETLTLDRDEPDEEIKDTMEGFGREIGFFHDRWANGLAAFLTTMQFASAQEAKNTEGLAEAVVNALLDAAIGATGAIPVVGTVVSLSLAAAKSVGLAALADVSPGSDVASYVNNLRTSIQTSRERMTRDLFGRKGELLDSYNEASDRSPPFQVVNHHAVVHGAAARWIRRYEEALSAFSDNIPSENRFRQLVTERFALAGHNVGYVTQGTFRASGTLTIGMEVRIDQIGNWHVDDIDDEWTLGVGGPNPARVARNLMESLNGMQVLAYANLPKQVTIEIDSEVPGNEFEGKVVKLSMSADRSSVFITTRSGDSELGQEAARNPTVALKLLEVNTIEGSDD